jgi:thiopeptide-type bacteriocin biosynthesis protein
MGDTQNNCNVQDIFDTNFFVLRTPLLSFNEFLGWSDGIKSRALHNQGVDSEGFQKAWTADVQVLRSRLRSILARPEVVHALLVASPSLQTGIEHWKRDPNSKRGLQAERAIVRYFERMSTRPTPFGTLAGYSVGTVDRQSSAVCLNLASRETYRTCTRLDFDYLFALTSALHRDQALIKELQYYPNSSLHRISDAWHYVESHLVGGKRSYDLAKVVADRHLDSVLERASKGATYHELLDAILTNSGESEVPTAEAEDYLKELINSQLLVSNLSPLLTGRPPLDDLIEQLSVLPSATQVSTTLQTVRTQLAALDTVGTGASNEHYREIAKTLGSLSVNVESERLFQVDMIKPVERLVLGKRVVAELLRGVDLLCRAGETSEPEDLGLFREAFCNRYEGALVPLLEALDEEVGVGFGRSAGDSSPLLRGLALGGGGISAQPPLSKWHAFLLKKLVENKDESVFELRLDLADFPAGTNSDYARLPDSFSVTATLAAASAAAIEAGDFDVDLVGTAGPSGATLTGRFCQSDPGLERCVRGLLQQEEFNTANAVYAEVVYVPEGRLGNVLSRPVLREYEIPYLTRSGAPQPQQIPVRDLLVGVSEARITLYSKRLECEVVPRLSNAHGFRNPALPPVYRFLCSLQHQFAVGVPGFTWGPLNNLDFLPRVRVGRLVLSLARWRLNKNDIEQLGKRSKSERFLAMQELRQNRKLPRWVVLHEADNALTADLDNPLSVDALVHVLKRRSEAMLTEMYPPPHLLCVTGPEGRFCHEINVAFVRHPEARQIAKQTVTRKPIPRANSILNHAIRTIGPGKDWLYVKLYGGDATLDEILTTDVLPLAGRANASELCRRWFFIRYADPHGHLRIRFNGQPNRLRLELMPLITEAFNPLLDSGRLWKIQFDTYEREIERYGGPQGMSISEDIFFADSQAAIEILKSLEGGEGLDSRWRIALLGVDRLLSDCGFDIDNKKITMERLRIAFNRELQGTADTKRRLSEKLRHEGKRLEALLEGSFEHCPELSFAGRIFKSRTSCMAPAIHNLRVLERDGLLHVDFSDLVTSYVHMHVNRLARSSARLYELVLYDFLFNLYDSKLARQRRTAKRMEPPETELENGGKTVGNPDVCAPSTVTGCREL